MKKFYILLIGLMMMFSLSSCETYMYATTQDDIYVETEVDIVRSDISFDIILRYGTPYYYEGRLLYYIYNNLYYYPYYYNNYWYVRAYRRPFPHINYRPYFRPHKYDYRFSPGQYRGFGRNDVMRHRHPNYNKPNRHPDFRPRHSTSERRPNINNHSNVRPNQQIRSNTRHSMPHRSSQINRNQNNHSRSFGGRR